MKLLSPHFGLCLIFIWVLTGCTKKTNFNKNVIQEKHKYLYSSPYFNEEKLPDYIKRVVILGTNDIHGQVESFEEIITSKTNPNLREIIEVGGFPLLSSYVNTVRDRYYNEVVLINSGDNFKGTLLSDLTKGSLVAKLMNQLSFDAATIGHYDFEFGGDSTDSQKIIKDLSQKLEFPMLASNIIDFTTGKPINWKNVRPYTIIERNGLKIAIIGAASTDTPSKTSAQNLNGLYFKSPEKSFLKYSTEARKKGADIVIGLIHAGGICSRQLSQKYKVPKLQVNFNTKTTKYCNHNSSIFRILDKLPRNTLDLVLAGDYSDKIANDYNGTIILQTPSRNRYLSRADLYYDQKQKKILLKKNKIHQPIKLCSKFHKQTEDCYTNIHDFEYSNNIPAKFLGNEIVEDQKTLEIIKGEKSFLSNFYNKRVAFLQFDIPYSQNSPSPLPFLIARGLKEYTLSDIGFTDIDSARKGLSKGPILFSEIYESLPFESEIVVLTLKGKKIKEFIKHIILEKDYQHGVFAGVKVVLNQKGDKIKTIKLENGETIDESKKYQLSTHLFLIEENSSHLSETFDDNPDINQRVIHNKTYRTALIELIKNNSKEKLKQFIHKSKTWILKI